VRTTAISGRFRKEVRRAERRGKDLAKLQQVIELLCRGQTLPTRYRDHALIGNFKGCRDCHLEPDWLLIYRLSKDGSMVCLERTGSHADLFG
jgi:mRNA interferase YafQ